MLTNPPTHTHTHTHTHHHTTHTPRNHSYLPTLCSYILQDTAANNMLDHVHKCSKVQAKAWKGFIPNNLPEG